MSNWFAILKQPPPPPPPMPPPPMGGGMPPPPLGGMPPPMGMEGGPGKLVPAKPGEKPKSHSVDPEQAEDEEDEIDGDDMQKGAIEDWMNQVAAGGQNIPHPRGGMQPAGTWDHATGQWVDSKGQPLPAHLPAPQPKQTLGEAVGSDVAAGAKAGAKYAKDLAAKIPGSGGIAAAWQGVLKLPQVPAAIKQKLQSGAFQTLSPTWQQRLRALQAQYPFEPEDPNIDRTQNKEKFSGDKSLASETSNPFNPSKFNQITQKDEYDKEKARFDDFEQKKLSQYWEAENQKNPNVVIPKKGSLAELSPVSSANASGSKEAYNAWTNPTGFVPSKIKG